MKKRKNKKKKLSLVRILFILLIFTGLGMAMAANTFSLNGFQARHLQNKMQNLLQEQEKLQLQITNLKSLKKITENDSLEGQMIPVDQLKHILLIKEPANSSAASSR